jgi:hypothetical protein
MVADGSQLGESSRAHSTVVLTHFWWFFWCSSYAVAFSPLKSDSQTVVLHPARGWDRPFQQLHQHRYYGGASAHHDIVTFGALVLSSDMVG